MCFVSFQLVEMVRKLLVVGMEKAVKEPTTESIFSLLSFLLERTDIDEEMILKGFEQTRKMADEVGKLISSRACVRVDADGREVNLTPFFYRQDQLSVVAPPVARPSCLFVCALCSSLNCFPLQHEKRPESVECVFVTRCKGV